MFLYELVSALVIAFLFALLFSVLFRRQDTSPGFTFAFVLFFLFAWAGGLWLAPLGPAIFGVYWLPGALLVLLIFLLLGVLVDREPRTRREAQTELEIRQAIGTLFGVFLWLLIVGLVIAIVLGYVAR